MSMPKLPEENNTNREEAVNLILTSIAMEELGLSHILNAEGEKLQYVLGTAKGTAGLEEPPTVENILEVNKSVRQTLSNATRLQMMLGAKMESAMSTSTMQGPTGAQGPAGLQGPAGPQGLEGPRGEQGIQGTPGLQGPQGQEGPKGPQGLTGPTGAQGTQGVQGIPGENGFSGITVRGNYDPDETYSINDYVVSDQGNGFVAHVNNPTGPPPKEFVSNDEWTAFVAAGAPGKQGVQGQQGQIGLTGPEGPRGPQGQQGIQGPQGREGPQGTQGSQGPTGSIGPKGEQGPAGSTGSKGEAGERGPTGPPGAGIGLIPFATGAGAVGLLDSRNGFATNVIFTGFGSSSKTVSITGTGFTLPTGNDFFFPISLAHAITIKSIYFTIANWATFTPDAGSTIIPYIILAVANQGESSFSFLNNTRTDVTVPWRGGVQIPANSTLYGSRININQPIPAGARLSICCAFDMKNGNPPWLSGYYFYYAGSIYYE